ncbi:MAG: hypothetical protein ABI794_17120 [Betaproteobacteria bacterium]
MHNRQVLILRFPALADEGRRGPVGVCENPGTGEQWAFASAEELWALVQAQHAVNDRPRTKPRALEAVARNPWPKPEEKS